jgi:ferric-dicitrate binding protein FerR (iron transport regulator)
MNAHRDGEQPDIDVIAEEIRQDRLDDATLTASADRVWRRLAEGWGIAAGTAAHRPLRTQQDYEALIDEYVQGRLSPGRRALVDEYARENPDFRKRIEQARTAGEAPQEPRAATPSRKAAPRAGRPIRHRPLAAVAVAAAVVAAIGLVAFYGLQGGAAALPRLSGSEGPAYLVTGEGPRLLGAGDEIPREAAVRTSRTGGAFVELADGSVIEMGERTQLSVAEARRGTTIDLDRGRVIVEAADQRTGQLFVATDDSVISVTGTVFSVNSGRKGSRVSVIEGEVRVDHNGRTEVLRPGQQVSTDPRLEAVALKEEIAWSRNVDRHLSLMTELIDVGREVEAALDPREPRHASPLLELVPEDAVLYAAVPNVSRNVDEAYRTFLDGVAASPVLSEWWNESVASQGADRRLDAVVEEVSELGSYLGDELVVTMSMPPEADRAPGGLVMARTGNAQGLRDYLVSRIERLRDAEGTELALRLVETPRAVSDENDPLLVWIHDGLVAASWRPEPLRQLALRRAAESLEPVDTPFRQRIRRAYREGVEWLMALDVATMTRGAGDAQAAEGDEAAKGAVALELLGLETAETVVTERKSTPTGTTHRAAISFSGKRTGLASVLARPAPIGALEMLSPETSAAAAAAMREPADVAREMLVLFDDLFPGFSDELERIEREQGIRVVQDLAEPLGGDVAVALDGPMLPVPAWKLVIEVYDADRLQHAIETIVQQVDAAMSSRLEQDVVLAIEPTTIRSRPAWTIGRAEGTPVVAYAFVDGYLVATPGPGHLERALRYHDAGARFVDTDRFDELLPADGHVHVSGLVFQDLGERLGGLIRAARESVETTERQSRMIDELQQRLSATLLVAYATEDQITLSTTSPKEKTSVDVVGALDVLGSVQRGSLADLLRGDAGPGAFEVR